MAEARAHAGAQTMHRLVAFADATVAIAMTLLVLPLVDLAPEVAEAPLLTVLGERTGELVAFTVSFAAVALFWRGSRRLFALLAAVDDGLVALTFLWLFVIVALPFSTALLGVGDGPRADTTVFYLLTLATGSLAALAQVLHARRRPALHEPGTTPTALRTLAVRDVVAAVVFVLAAVAATAWPVPALYGLLVLPVALRAAERLVRVAR